MQYLSVSEVARPLGLRPKDISDLFYQRELPDDACPVVGGRRLISPDYVPVIVNALRKKGYLKDSSPEETQANEPTRSETLPTAVGPATAPVPASGMSVTLN